MPLLNRVAYRPGPTTMFKAWASETPPHPIQPHLTPPHSTPFPHTRTRTGACETRRLLGKVHDGRDGCGRAAVERKGGQGMQVQDACLPACLQMPLTCTPPQRFTHICAPLVCWSALISLPLYAHASLQVISVDVPNTVELEVMATDPGVSGNTKSGEPGWRAACRSAVHPYAPTPIPNARETAMRLRRIAALHLTLTLRFLPCRVWLQAPASPPRCRPAPSSKCPCLSILARGSRWTRAPTHIWAGSRAESSVWPTLH